MRKQVAARPRENSVVKISYVGFCRVIQSVNKRSQEAWQYIALEPGRDEPYVHVAAGCIVRESNHANVFLARVPRRRHRAIPNFILKRD